MAVLFCASSGFPLSFQADTQKRLESDRNNGKVASHSHRRGTRRLGEFRLIPLVMGIQWHSIRAPKHGKP